MYRPDYSRKTDDELAFELLREYPLGLLITTGPEGLQTSYLPFFVERRNNDLYLVGHLAKANPQWKGISSKAIVSFQGPQSYVSPTIYKSSGQVPTWAYAVVQIGGQPEIIVDQAGIFEILQSSTAFFEDRNGTNWTYTMPPLTKTKLQAAIVGIRIKITQIDAKFKLSQNRSDEDYRAVLNHFSGNAQTSSIYRWFEKTKA